MSLPILYVSVVVALATIAVADDSQPFGRKKNDIDYYTQERLLSEFEKSDLSLKWDISKENGLIKFSTKEDFGRHNGFDTIIKQKYYLVLRFSNRETKNKEKILEELNSFTSKAIELQYPSSSKHEYSEKLEKIKKLWRPAYFFGDKVIYLQKGWNLQVSGAYDHNIFYDLDKFLETHMRPILKIQFSGIELSNKK